jgi:hypothetical protein
MSTSDVSICNAALIKLGADPIIALTDDTNRARTIAARYEAVRDAELRRRRWRFTIKRTSLAADADAPDSDFDYAYSVPNDFLRLIEGADIVQVADMSDYRSGGNELYSLENGMILTDLGAPLAIRYIARITDPALFDVAFNEALACRLAFECCEKITQSDSKKQLVWGDYKNSIREATLANALEVCSQSTADDTWVIARAQ